MGEKIKILDSFQIDKTKFDIELNEGTKGEKYIIHLQNKRINLSYKDYNFVKFATCFMAAKERLEKFKEEK